MYYSVQQLLYVNKVWQWFIQIAINFVSNIHLNVLKWFVNFLFHWLKVVGEFFFLFKDKMHFHKVSISDFTALTLY